MEADFHVRLEAAETTIREKDAIIGAIGHNITELKSENARVRQDLQLQKDVLEMTQQDSPEVTAVCSQYLIEQQEQQERRVGEVAGSGAG